MSLFLDKPWQLPVLFVVIQHLLQIFFRRRLPVFETGQVSVELFIVTGFCREAFDNYNKRLGKTATLIINTYRVGLFQFFEAR